MGKLTEAQKGEVVEMFMAGSTGPQIAKSFGVSFTPIYAVLRARGIQPKAFRAKAETPDGRRKLVRLDEILIANRYGNGETLSSLASSFGVCIQTIANVARKHGASSHPRGNSPRQFSESELAGMKEDWGRTRSIGAVARKFHTAPTRVGDLLEGLGCDVIKGAKRGPDHHSWKGGRIKGVGGYVQVLLDKDSPFAPMRNGLGYVQQHRLVMAEHLGRPLEAWETVHHIDGDRANNEISNLQLRTGQHGAGVVYECLSCGSHNVKPAKLSAREGV